MQRSQPDPEWPPANRIAIWIEQSPAISGSSARSMSQLAEQTGAALQGAVGSPLLLFGAEEWQGLVELRIRSAVGSPAGSAAVLRVRDGARA